MKTKPMVLTSVLVLLVISCTVLGDLSQLGRFVGYWLCEGDCEYDINDDNMVNFVDYSYLVNCLSGGNEKLQSFTEDFSDSSKKARLYDFV